LDYVLAAIYSYVGSILLKNFLPSGYWILVRIYAAAQHQGELITNFISRCWHNFAWLIFRNPPNPDHSVDFESKAIDLSHAISSAVPPAVISPSDDEYYAQHGKIYIKLFQIARCMDWHSHKVIDPRNKRKLRSQYECLQAVMKNYHHLSASQIIHSCSVCSSLKPLFEST
jgi:hypothetical protein